LIVLIKLYFWNRIIGGTAVVIVDGVTERVARVRLALKHSILALVVERADLLRIRIGDVRYQLLDGLRCSELKLLHPREGTREQELGSKLHVGGHQLCDLSQHVSQALLRHYWTLATPTATETVESEVNQSSVYQPPY